MSVSSRSALEVMRLVELLLVLVMEGRKALPKTCPHPAIAAKRLDSFSGDRSHRQVIEAIRAGNNDEFFEAMESGEWGVVDHWVTECTSLCILSEGGGSTVCLNPSAGLQLYRCSWFV